MPNSNCCLCSFTTAQVEEKGGDALIFTSRVPTRGLDKCALVTAKVEEKGRVAHVSCHKSRLLGLPGLGKFANSKRP